MKNYFLKSPLVILIFLLSLSVQGQNRKKAEQSVQDYLKTKYVDYKPHSFGECFTQTYPKDMQREIKATKEVKYSIVHSYKIGDKIIKDEYFHLDKNYQVLGQVSNERMLELASNMVMEALMEKGILDKLSADTTSSKVKENVEESELVNGIMNMQIENFEEAIKHFSKTIELNPKYGNAYFKRGQCYLKLNKNDLACKDFQSSKRLNFVDIELDEALKTCK